MPASGGIYVCPPIRTSSRHIENFSRSFKIPVQRSRLCRIRVALANWELAGQAVAQRRPAGRDTFTASAHLARAASAWPWCWRVRQQDTAKPRAAGQRDADLLCWVGHECAVIYRMTLAASGLSAYNSESGSSSAARQRRYFGSQNTDHCWCSRTMPLIRTASSGVGWLVMRMLP